MKPAAVFREVAAGLKTVVVLTKSPVNTHAGFARTLLPQEKQVYRRTSNSNNEACVSCSENFQSNYRRAGKGLSSLSFQHEGVCSSSDGCDNPLLGSRAPSPARARQKKRTGVR